MLSDDELKAVNCLRSGSWLINPKYQFPQAAHEAKLKERCKACWAMRAHFPKWVLEGYVNKWIAEKNGDAA